MTVIETTNFAQDIASIDAFLKGKINQETWQSKPIEHEGKMYIKYKEKILKDWIGNRKIETITIEENV